MIYVTRRAEFSASHYYHNPDFTPEENRKMFGKCNNPHGHGHNYALEVTVAGEPDARTGMVIDLKDLKKVIEAEVMEAMDHRFLNEEVPAFRTLIPTTENIAIEVWRRLAAKIVAGRLCRVRLYETPELYVDYYGE
jgi:6-pyruvoyltetrahydropterin/6-carboxytetrahydropterin synthase